VLGAGRARARSVLYMFNEDEVKHAGQKQQQQSKKHTQRKLGWPARIRIRILQLTLIVISDAQLDTRAALNAHAGVGCVCAGRAYSNKRNTWAGRPNCRLIKMFNIVT
jgi:hypothetical protein